MITEMKMLSLRPNFYDWLYQRFEYFLCSQWQTFCQNDDSHISISVIRQKFETLELGWLWFPVYSFITPSIDGISWETWARFLSLAQSNLRLCSANHRAGYFCNLACDWLSIVWASSEQETENGPRSAKSTHTSSQILDMKRNISVSARKT